jgi:hypothetical protein
MNNRELLTAIEDLAADHDFAQGSLWFGNAEYKYLIETWFPDCIEGIVREENGDWEDDEYLYGVVQDMHEQLIKTEFEDKGYEVLHSAITEAEGLGKSIVVTRAIESG